MFSWITGPRITNVVEDLQSAHADQTYIDPPDTPAPVFAVKAFKQAIFGTPHPDLASKPIAAMKSAEPKPSQTKDTKPREVAPGANAKREPAPFLSPLKTNGILMTPGTGAKGRKTVQFGAQVADNEGKPKIGRSGIPNDCPGKFPSPWTPGTEILPDDNKPRTKLTAALYDARESNLPKSATRPRAKDDQDITLDHMEPRSQSGKFWKEQYLSYAENCEKEMNKLIKKERLARSYAKKKDADAKELEMKLSEEKKRHRQQEKSLEEQMKDFQERLRQAMAENARASMEISTLKVQLEATQKKGDDRPDEGYMKNSTSIHEDPAQATTGDQRATILAKPTLPASANRESTDSPSARPRRARRSTAPDSSHMTTSASALPAASKTPLGVRQAITNKENLPPNAPAHIAPGASTGIWSPNYASSPGDMDRMALPISSAPLPARSNTTSKIDSAIRMKHSRKKVEMNGESRVETSRAKVHEPSKLRERVSMSGDSSAESLREKVNEPASLRKKMSNGGEPRKDSLREKADGGMSKDDPEKEERKRLAWERIERRKADKGMESQLAR